MSGLPNGAVVNVPQLEGRWSIWGVADEGPGARTVVPANDEARATGVKYAVVRIKYPPTAPFPDVQLIRTDPPKKKD